MTTINTHVSKPSYFGDQETYEFPSSASTSTKSRISSNDESLLKKDHIYNTNHKVEQFSTILIKSGIRPPSPFPLDREEPSESDEFELIKAYWKSEEDDTVPINFEKQNISKEIENENEHENKTETETETETESKAAVLESVVNPITKHAYNSSKEKTMDVVDSIPEEKPKNEIPNYEPSISVETLQPETQVLMNNDDIINNEIKSNMEASRENVDNKERSNTEESYYGSHKSENSQSFAFTPKNSILRKRTSLNQAPYTKSFVNPYLRKSVLRRHEKELEKDELLSKRLDSMKNKNVDNANSVKTIEQNSIHETGDDSYDQSSEVINKDALVIPRRSSKRNLARFNSFQRRTNSLLRLRSKINRSDSKKSIKTLSSNNAADKNTFKSVDMTGLDNLLNDLINYKESSKLGSQSRSVSLNSKPTLNDIHEGHENNFAESISKDESFGTSKIKPFNVSRSLSRKKSLARSISTVSNELNSITDKTSISTRSHANKPLPPLPGQDFQRVQVTPKRADSSSSKYSSNTNSGTTHQVSILNLGGRPPSTPTSNNNSSSSNNHSNIQPPPSSTYTSSNYQGSVSADHSEKCELKRSNAVKRKSIFIESLIEIYRALKRGIKKCWRIIKNPNKRGVIFQRKRSIKSKDSKVKISNPVLVDITETAFKNHMINSSSMDNIKSAKAVVGIKQTNNKSVRGVSPAFSTTGSSLLNPGRLSTIVSVSGNEAEVEDASKISLLKEDDVGLGDMNDQLVVLWKHYLKTTIRNRIDMKVDIDKINFIERVKSIHSLSSRRNSLDEKGKLEVEKLMDKYITSGESSRCSTMTGYGSESMVTALEYNDGISNRSESIAQSTSSRLSGNTWKTIESEGETGSETDDVSSISTIEEEGSGSTISSISGDHDVSDVYDDYSMISDEEEVAIVSNDNSNSNSNDYSNDIYTSSKSQRSKLSELSGMSVVSTKQQQRIKQSDRMLNLQSVLKQGSIKVTSGIGSNKFNGGSVRTMYSNTNNSVYTDSDDRSDAFSYSRSINASVCRI